MTNDPSWTLLAGAVAAAVAGYSYYFVQKRQSSLKLPYCPVEGSMVGRTVVVTGANTGLGKHTALQIAKAGGDVVLACRNMDKASQTSQELRKQLGRHAGSIYTMKLDLSKLESVRNFVENLEEEQLKGMAPLYALVNNAGAMFPALRLAPNRLFVSSFRAICFGASIFVYTTLITNVLLHIYFLSF
jgi:short-subunit dehydrogenase involved in D-alanine esterification of teichoic acids